MFRARTHAGNLPHRTAELSDAAVAAAEPTGFENRTDSTLGFTTSTRTVDVTPTSDAFHVWEASRKSRFESAQTLAITNVTGTHIVYFDEGVIAESVNPADSAIDTLIRTKPLACHVYWNATDGAAVYVGEERHGINYPGDVHSDMHWNRGFARQFGLALNTLSTDQDGSSNAHAQFGTDAGGANDEDIHHSIAAVASATGLPILYKTGASGEWHRTTNAGYSVTTIGTGRLAYNEWTGATWQLTEVTNGRYVLCHVVATGDKDTPMMAIVGEEEYTNIVDARQGATTEIGTISTAGLPGPEMLFLATVILQTSNSYTNAVKARTRTADTGDDYLWWGDSGVTRTNPPGNNDPDAFHQSASGEIAGLTEKTAPASGDNFLIEDNASSDSKSRVDAVRLILADGTNPLTADWDAGSSRDIKCAIHFAQDGTAIAPSFAFTNDADNGLYLKSTNTLGISTAKIEREDVDSAGKLWVLYAA
ncbi:MAG: hypothetical protein ACE5F8_08250, partial [Woeseiaceae bacterium]